MIQVFASHTKEDEKFCDGFDRVAARVGIRVFRSEFETIKSPAWKTIKNAMHDSIALFFLVGEELVKNQDLRHIEWEHTQNWIAYEIGLACSLGIDVWAICDDTSINFPMPYINNYLTVSLKHKDAFSYLRGILEIYKEGQTFPFPYIKTDGKKLGISCPYEGCNIQFNLHVKLNPGEKIKCPHCLRDMIFEKGFLL